MPNDRTFSCVERAVMHSLIKRFKLEAELGGIDDDSYVALNPIDFALESKTLNDFSKRLFLGSFLQKWKGLRISDNPEKVALTKWISSERECFRTNVRLEHEASTGLYSVAPHIISDAQRKILLVLGRTPNFNILDMLSRFGPGATLDLRRGSDVADKISSELTITPHAAVHAIRCISGDMYFQHGRDFDFSSFREVRGNRCVMVPKNAKTHRPIAIEPTLNSFLQQGAGRFIRQRLMRFGVDLNDQSINKNRAKDAYSKNLSTIDLSSASDTVSTNLVKLLLPPDWFDYLDDIRSHVSYWGSRAWVNSKFSSMGNAFTFELESLIFWALCSSTVSDPSTISVYGDDIICRREDFDAVVQTLLWAGFQVNTRKSYKKGVFFESCGGQYCVGFDVTPAYQKDLVRKPIEFVRLHNRLLRASLRLGLFNEFIDARRIVVDWYVRTFGTKPPFGPLQSDDSWFADPNLNPNFVDGKLLAFVRVVSFKTRSCDSGYLAMKFRDPSRLNVLPNGRAAKERGEKYVLRKKFVWRSGNT